MNLFYPTLMGFVKVRLVKTNHHWGMKKTPNDGNFILFLLQTTLVVK